MQHAPNAPGTARIGTVLSSRWRLIQKIGEGVTSEVYVGETIAGGERVAIKLLRLEYVPVPSVHERFICEARICLRLVHPNIARVFEGATSDDGVPYVVMELLHGVPLRAYTANGGRVLPSRAAPILKGILSGLAAAHDRGILHGDLKPSNVFLMRGTDAAFVVKLRDFGIAKNLDTAGGTAPVTRSHSFWGEGDYISPEQAQRSDEVDFRTDLWSAGVIFYEMVTGKLPFRGGAEVTRLTALLRDDPTPIESVDPSLAPLSAFVSRALRKSQDERFESAHAMAVALDAAMSRFGCVDVDAMSSAGTEAIRLRPPTGPLSRDAIVVRGEPPSGVAANPDSEVDDEPVRRKSVSTLASAVEPARSRTKSAPQVVVVGTTFPTSTLNSPRRVHTDVSRRIVATLVALALAVGFALGWVLKR